MHEKCESTSRRTQWLIGEGSINTIEKLVSAFRSSVVAGRDIAFVPWLESFPEHQTLGILESQRTYDGVLVDQPMLERIETAFTDPKDKIALGLLLPEEKSFRVRSDIEANPVDLAIYHGALTKFRSVGPYWQRLFTAVCEFIVPIYSTQSTVRSGGIGFSSLKARGAIFLSVPRCEEFQTFELSINIAHELGHQVLMIYQGADRILTDESLQAPIYSPIRKTMRPAILAFHGVVALVFMVTFVEDLLAGSDKEPVTTYLKTKLVQLRGMLADGVDACSSLEFTEVGKILFNECHKISSDGRRVALVSI